MRSAARRAREEILCWLRSLRFTVHILEGSTARGHPLLVLYAGAAPYRHYLRRRLFVDGGNERPLGRYWLWQLPAVATHVGADLRMTRCAKILRAAVCNRRSFYLPEWLWCEMALDAEALFNKPSREQRKALRRLKNNRLTYAATTDPKALRHFYDRMYVPMTLSSHGESAQLMSLPYLMERVAAGEAELVSILQGEVAVGGCIVVYDDGQARLFSQGVLDASHDLLRQRVGVAIYLYSFAHLLERGFTRVNLGRSRPLLEDGPLNFKTQLGAKITTATRGGVVLEPLRPSTGAIDFLCDNPFICEDGSGLRAVVFGATESGLPAQPDAAAPPGVERVTFMSVNQAFGVGDARLRWLRLSEDQPQ